MNMNMRIGQELREHMCLRVGRFLVPISHFNKLHLISFDAILKKCTVNLLNRLYGIKINMYVIPVHLLDIFGTYPVLYPK